MIGIDPDATADKSGIAKRVEEFEKAAKLRDKINAIKKVTEKQKVVGDGKLSRDVFALSTSGSIGALSMLSIRSGSLINKNEFIIK